MLFQRSWFEKSEWFALDEALFDPWWVATREMRVLKCFSSFATARLDIQAKNRSPL